MLASAELAPAVSMAASSPVRPSATEVAEEVHGLDVALMGRVSRGDEAAQRVAARRLLPVARRVARALVRDTCDADDAVQLSLIEILRSAHTFRGETAVERWAQRIVVRTTLRWIREQRRYHRVVDESAQAVEVSTGSVRVERSSDGLPRPVNDYLERISDVQREAVLLRHALGYTVSEIAELTGVSENTAKARLLYGRRALRRLVRRDLNIGITGAEQGNNS